MIDPQPDFQPEPGVPETLQPGVRRILAPNPSPMTFRGTNTYLVGDSDIAVIDPGPEESAHLGAILEALRPGQRVTHVLVSHAHLDHSPLARRLADHCAAPVLAFGPATSGRSLSMQALAASGLVGGGEGVDAAFEPDIRLSDTAEIAGAGWRITALHTPGHMANHLAFALGDVLFSADLVMGWATSLVSPPDGDLGAFMASLARLQTHPWRRFLPGHGAPVDDPAERLGELIRHRRARAESIARALAAAPADAASLAAAIYTDTPPALLPAAERNVLAHLIEMCERNLARPRGPLTAKAIFEAL